MASPTKREIAPMFEAYGAACFEAQHLERSLRLLMAMIEARGQKRDVKNEPSPTALMRERNVTLVDLFKVAQGKEYFTDAEKKAINNAIKERNFVVHSYWDKKIALGVTPAGRQWIIANLNQLRALFRNASLLISSLLDKHLAEYGLDVQYFSDKTDELWKSGMTPPASLLH